MTYYQRTHRPDPLAALLSTTEVAARAGVHVATVHRAVTAGALVPTAKAPGLRGGFLFALAAVDRWIDRRVAR